MAGGQGEGRAMPPRRTAVAVRRWPAAGLVRGRRPGMIALLAAVLAVQCAPPPPAVELKSPDGQRSLTLTDAGLELTVAGKGRISLGELPSGSLGLALFDASGTRRAVVGLPTVGGPRLTFLDADGTHRIVLDVRLDSSAHLAFFDESGTQRMAVLAEPDGSPGIALFDGGGIQRAAVGGSADGAVGMAFFGSDGGERALFNVEPDGQPGLVLYDDTGQERVVLEVTADGHPHFGLIEGEDAGGPEAPGAPGERKGPGDVEPEDPDELPDNQAEAGQARARPTDVGPSGGGRAMASETRAFLRHLGIYDARASGDGHGAAAPRLTPPAGGAASAATKSAVKAAPSASPTGLRSG